MDNKDIFGRSELLLGSEAMEVIAQKKVIVFGIGGVGSWCAEALVRSGIMHLTIVDSDLIAPSNINRQIPATTKTVGRLKVEIMRNRLLEINPNANIIAIPEIYSESSSSRFMLETYDYIIDAIDSLSHKVHLLITASKTDATIFSSAGAALKLDVRQIRIDEFWKVRGCKLSSALRKRVRKSGGLYKEILCVYSEELLPNSGDENSDKINENGSFRKAQINGTMVFITASFGLALAGLVIQHIVSSCE